MTPEGDTYKEYLHTSTAMKFAFFPIEGDRKAIMWFLVDQISHPPRCPVCSYQLGETRKGSGIRDWCAACENKKMMEAGKAFVPDMGANYVV